MSVTLMISVMLLVIVGDHFSINTHSLSFELPLSQILRTPRGFRDRRVSGWCSNMMSFDLSNGHSWRSLLYQHTVHWLDGLMFRSLFLYSSFICSTFSIIRSRLWLFPRCQSCQSLTSWLTHSEIGNWADICLIWRETRHSTDSSYSTSSTLSSLTSSQGTLKG